MPFGGWSLMCMHEKARDGALLKLQSNGKNVSSNHKTTYVYDD